ncbi:MsnO8 family LLM class oxidoreductase [Streptosporangium sp. NPDC000396]|uniref:MsnO8 family LLM class oxidoreductase n=1 Tax=Streptosporangium sp. NPDC000396 TaxID=3366185 RepID=UPI0036B9B176
MTLSILDLAPIVSGGTAHGALSNTLDLARRAEEFGYHRYWLAEHHFAPGVASSAPAVLVALVAAATSTIRVGSGAVQLGHQTPLSVVEQFGLIDALYPGRVDLGIGRSGQRRSEPAEPAERAGLEPKVAERAGSEPGAAGRAGSEPEVVERPRARTVGGLLIPPPFDWSHLAKHPQLVYQASLLQQPGARTPDFAGQIDDVLAFLNGTHEARAVPGEGADVQVWILGSSGGQSAQVAGERGLPFAANYHVSPSSVLEAVEAYREAFKPSDALAEPYVIVSADAVVAEDEAKARELAGPYGLWVRSIRTGAGAMPYPTPAEAGAHVWTAADRELVKDRVDTQFVGAPEQVAERLRVLRRVTGADELLVTTITHDHVDRVRSYELLAEAWNRQ